MIGRHQFLTLLSVPGGGVFAKFSADINIGIGSNSSPSSQSGVAFAAVTPEPSSSTTTESTETQQQPCALYMQKHINTVQMYTHTVHYVQC